MRWFITLQRDADGWSVRYALPRKSDAAERQDAVPPPRLLRRADDPGSGQFPLVPGDAAAIGDAPLQELCDGTAIAKLIDLYRRVVTQSIDGPRLQLFGRYLFEVLLGEQVWGAMTADVGPNDDIELILSWPPEETALTRLPWEAMHDGASYLAGRRRFAFTRCVANARRHGGTVAPVRPMSLPPRVLFVVGSGGRDRDFAGLKPGVEYLGILGTLKEDAIGLKHALMVGATRPRLEAMIKSFQPDVVHFICHGDPRGLLELVDEQDDNQRIGLGADALMDVLYPAGLACVTGNGSTYAGPVIVVLSACHSAAQGGVELHEAGQVCFPLAVQLVLKGVPMVVGMAGEVADQACRLFGCGFYASLLLDGRVGMAAARGRRAGLLYGAGSDRIDWCLPTLFISDALDQPAVTLQPDDGHRDWSNLATDLARRSRPYYARLDVMRYFEVLMLAECDQRRYESRHQTLQVLVLSSDPARSGGSLGNTETLKYMAAQAALDGHLPIVISKQIAGTPSTAIASFVEVLRRAVHATLQCLRIEAEATCIALANTRAALRFEPGVTPQDDLPDFLRYVDSISNREERDSLVATGMRRDLHAVLDYVRKRFGRPTCKLLLLVDDIHEMGDVMSFILRALLDDTEFTVARRDDFRVICTYKRTTKAEDAASREQIMEFVQHKHVLDVELFPFKTGTESRLAFEHLLFHWDDGDLKSLVPSRNGGEKVNDLFESLQEETRGVPSSTHPTRIGAVIRLAAKPHMQILVKADDFSVFRSTE